METFLVSFTFVILSAIRIQTPLTIGALGGMFSEKSGVVNIAIEGLMLTGAFMAVVVSYFTKNAFLGVLGGIAAGTALSLLHALVSIKYKGNQTISGTAINILAASLTVYFMRLIFATEGITPAVTKLPSWGIGNFSFNPVVYLSFLLVPICWFVIFKTRFGLHIRAVGEHPQAADTMGIKVEKVRYLAVMISGALSGLAGAYLSLGDGDTFQRNMTSGRGFMALAVLIIGKWHPVSIFISAFLFALADAFQISISTVINIPNQITAMIPYVMTLIVLAGLIGKSVAPAAVGKPYNKGER